MIEISSKGAVTTCACRRFGSGGATRAHNTSSPFSTQAHSTASDQPALGRGPSVTNNAMRESKSTVGAFDADKAFEEWRAQIALQLAASRATWTPGSLRPDWTPRAMDSNDTLGSEGTDAQAPSKVSGKRTFENCIMA